MRPRKVPTSTKVFTLPGGNEDNDLWVEIAEDENHAPCIVSVWELTNDERKAIAEGGTIELCVWGTRHPPVSLAVGESIDDRRRSPLDDTLTRVAVDNVHDALHAYLVTHTVKPTQLAIAVEPRYQGNHVETLFGIPVVVDDTVEPGTLELRCDDRPRAYMNLETGWFQLKDGDA